MLRLEQSLLDLCFFTPTVVWAVNLRSLLYCPMTAFWKMRTIFWNLGHAKLFPFETKIRELLNKQYLNFMRLCWLWKQPFCSHQTQKKIFSVPVLDAENLPAYVEEDLFCIFANFVKSTIFYDDNIDEPVCIVLGGDNRDT